MPIVTEPPEVIVNCVDVGAICFVESKIKSAENELAVTESVVKNDFTSEKP